MKILASLEGQRKPFLVCTGLILIGIIGFIDYLTGYEFAFSIFYVFPISLVTWFMNQRLGLVASVTSAIIWLVADIASGQSYSSLLVPFWNCLIRFTFFMLITLLLSYLKNSLQLTHTDYSTSAINSRYFHQIVRMEMNRSQRNQHPFTVAYIDIDNFKAVNDQLGHMVGNQVLVTLVNSIGNIIRKSDFIARLGGDEFAILFPETDQEAARAIFGGITKSV